MIKLIVDNVYTQIENASKDIEKKIWEELSFEVQEFNNKSDYIPRRHLFNRKTKKTYTGLLDFVLEILVNNDEDYTVIDNRIKHEPNANFKLVDYLDEEKTIRLEARDYQQEIIDRITEREVIQACTGAGKTFMMAAIIAKLNVKPVSVFADKLSLCTQLKEEFEKFLGIKIGLVGGGIRDIQDITIYSIQSVKEDDVKDSKAFLMDECLTYDTRVLMEDFKYEKIGKLVENNINNITNKKVLSYNHSTNKLESKSIISHSKTKLKDNNKKLMRITFFNKLNYTDWVLEIIECTDNHKFFVCELNDYIQAKDLKVDQTVIYSDNTQIIIKGVEYIEFSKEKNSEEKYSEKEYKEMYVYDIGVEDNHNFFANNILVHNCHHIPSMSAVEVAKMCTDAYYRIGVSATPWRDGGDDMLIEAILRKRRPEYAINASKLIKKGYLVPATIYFVPMKQIIKGKNYHNVYNEAIVNNEERNNAIVKIALKMKETRNASTLILIQRVEHGTKLQNKLYQYIKQESTSVTVDDPKTGKATLVRVKNVEFLSGQDEPVRRKAVLQAVKDGFCKILIGSTIADEGLDVPILDTLILAGAGKSSTRAFQRIGRVIRLYTDKNTGVSKSRAIVFDFKDYTPMLRRHSRTREKLYLKEEEWEVKQLNPSLLDD